MPFQVTLPSSRIVFANALTNTLNGSSQGDWEITVNVNMPSADASNERLFGMLSQGASTNRSYYARDGASFTIRDNAGGSVGWGSFSSSVTFDAVNTIRITKLAANTYPDLYINDVLITRTLSGGSWQTVPLFGNIGENFNTFSGITVSAFSYVDNIDALNNMIFGFDGELATPQISETVDGDTPSFSGAGTPVWSSLGGIPTIDTDVNEGTPINIYTGEGLTGTPVITIRNQGQPIADGVSVPYTGALPNLVVPTDLISKTAVFHGWDLDAPLILRVIPDSGPYDSDIIIRSRTGYGRIQMMFPNTGAGSINSQIVGLTIDHNTIMYYQAGQGLKVYENGDYEFLTGSTVPIRVGKYAENGVNWYPATLVESVGADTTIPVITMTSGTDSIIVGGSWVDAGATATDNIDGNITANIVTTGSVDVNTVGSYSIFYNVSDAAGNAATQVTRTVTVADDVTPDVPDLGLDVTDAEPSAYVTRSFVTSGVTTSIAWPATGSAQVSPSAGSGFGASVNAGNGVTLYARIQASATFGGVVSGGVAGDSFSVTTRAQVVPVLPATLSVSGYVDQVYSRTLTATGDTPTSWAITGGVDAASYTLSNAGLLQRASPNDTVEDEVITVTATNAAGTSVTMTLTISYTEITQQTKKLTFNKLTGVKLTSTKLQARKL